MTNTKLKNKKAYAKKYMLVFEGVKNIKEKWLILLCALALSAVKNNSFMAVLPLVLLQLCKDKTALYLCSAAATVYYIFTFTHTAFYVPCVAFAMVYLLGDYMLQQSSVKPIWFAAGVYVLCKIYVLSFGYQAVYFAVFAVEAVAVILLPDIVSEGCILIKTNRENLSAMQFFEAAAALITLSAALSGLNVYGFNVSVWFLFSAALYFVLKDNIPLSLTSFICMSVMVCQDKNFSFLFAGFLAIYLGGSALLKQGNKGYIYTVLLAAVISLLFITKFNSFVFITITAAALAASFAADKFYTFSLTDNKDNILLENDYIQLSHKIEKLNQCFHFLGHTVIDISNLIAKEDIPKDISDIVAQKVCNNCSNSTLCWQENYSYTQKQFSNYAYNLQKGREAFFDSLFLSRCDKISVLKQQFLQAHQLEHTKQLISRSGMHNQKILQNQFFTIAQVLQDITRQAANCGAVNTACTHTINNFLLAMNKRPDYCICYHNRPRCVIGIKEELAESEIQRINTRLENLYNAKFKIGTKTTAEQQYIYSFVQVPQYSCQFSAQSKSRYSVCGDICESFETEDRFFVILADGMGTGSFAAAESRTAVAMLKSLLSSGVKVHTALEITNTAFNLKGTGQSCVAVDILAVDCCSGRCCIYKAGGASTIIFDKGKIKRVYQESLPIGILKEVKIQQTEFTLANGGVVIMLSDGAQPSEENLYKLQLMLPKLTEEEIAEFISEQSDTADDATAAAIRLIRQ